MSRAYRVRGCSCGRALRFSRIRRVRYRRNPPPIVALDELPALTAAILLLAADEEYEVKVHGSNGTVALNPHVGVLRIEAHF